MELPYQPPYPAETDKKSECCGAVIMAQPPKYCLSPFLYYCAECEERVANPFFFWKIPDRINLPRFSKSKRMGLPTFDAAALVAVQPMTLPVDPDLFVFKEGPESPEGS